MCGVSNEEMFRRIESKMDLIIQILDQMVEKKATDNNPIMNTVILVKRGVTQNSGSPMWRMVTFSGHQVNVFLHSDPDKNNFPLIENAGYAEEFLDMQPDTEKSFTRFPIHITMKKDGKWWQLVSVDTMPPNGKSDLMELNDIKKQFDEADF